MCQGFGCIVNNNLDVYFCEPDKEGSISHSEILLRLNWPDNDDAFVRRFVRVECMDWTVASFRFDEDQTLPGWAEQNRVEIINRVELISSKIAQALAEYEKVRAQAWAEYEKVRDQAWAEYVKVRAPAWAEYEKVRDQAWAEYVIVCAPALAEYEKVRAQALAEYVKVRAPTWAEYVIVCAPAWAEYVKVRAQALAEYEKVCAPAWAAFVSKISTIQGYVPAATAGAAPG